MITIIFLFIIISILASLVVVAACVKSSHISQWENLPETYSAQEDERELAPTTQRHSLTQAA